MQSGAVTWSSGLTFAVAAVAAGDYTVNSVVGAVYAGGNVVLATQDATLPRIDTIVITAAGAVSAITGVPRGPNLVYAASSSGGSPTTAVTTSGPAPTAPSSAQLEIARIYVPATGTALSASSITDRRTPLVLPVFDGIRAQWRANRRLVAEFGGVLSNVIVGDPVGSGWALPLDADGPTTVVLTGESYIKMNATTAGNSYLLVGSGLTAASLISPSHSPRLLVRTLLPVASANITQVSIGFVSNVNSTTAQGALIRILTTGNPFFVTRQGASETTTDLGTTSRTVILGYEIETPDAGVTWVLRNQAGTQLASSTTNVPTAGTALGCSFSVTSATAGTPLGAAYGRLEGTFA